MSDNNQAEQDRLYRIRHSAAHVMAEAVLELYPEAKIAIGPPIDTGFYYDFDLGKDEDGKPRTFSPEDLEQIEKRMRQIIGGRHPFVYREVSADEARTAFDDQPYKLELIDGLDKGGVDEYGNEVTSKAGHQHLQAGYVRGPVPRAARGAHGADSAGRVQADERGRGVLAWRRAQPDVAAHLWHGLAQQEGTERVPADAGRGQEARPSQAGPRPGDLHLRRGSRAGAAAVAAQRRRHDRRVGEVGQRDGGEAGYQRVRTPTSTKEDLFLRSGHLPYYAESMYPPMELEGVRYYVKPMNCPMHHKIFGSRPRSYRELPVRLAEYGTCYRYEKSGELFGLMRVRSMQMNDAHIYCTEEQFEQEFMGVVALYHALFELFGIDKYVMRFSTHHAKGLGKKYVDNERLWQKTEEMVRRAMQQRQRALCGGAGRGRLLWPQDRRADLERDRPRVHAGDQSGGLCPAGALRPDVCQRRG